MDASHVAVLVLAMDDLASLDFGAPAQRTAQGAPSSYNFDALLRSMPSSKPAAPSKPAPPSKGATPKGPTGPSSSDTDAFSSLLPSTFTAQASKPMNTRPVSYTHLTLPTILRV